MERITAALFIGGLTLACSARVLGEEHASIPEDVRRSVQERVDNGQTVGLIVGVVDQNGTAYFARGAPRKGSEQPVDEHTLFEIGSVTKVFTAALLAKLAEHGTVSLDDPIGGYLPAEVKVAPPVGAITLQQLAGHTSGLPRLPLNFDTQAVRNPYAGYTAERLYEFLGDYTLPTEARATYTYSNLGAGLLGHLLSLRAGKSYEQLVVELIAEPLGMKDTCVTLTVAQRERLAQGHAGDQPAGNWDFAALAGCGALRSSAADMLRFIGANLGLFETTLEPALKKTRTGRRDTGTPGLQAAWGWHVWTKFDREIFWHNGGTGGYHAFCGFAPAEGRGVVVLGNSTHDIDDIGLHLLDPRFELQPVRKIVAVPEKILDDYVGYYEVQPGRVFHVARERDQLLVQLTGQNKYPIYPESSARFFYKVVDAQITFQRDDDNKVTGLVLHQGGADHLARKLGPDYKPPPQRTAIPVPAEILRRYVGEYELAPGAVVKVTLDGDRLMVQFPNQPPHQVFPDSPETFFYKGIDAAVLFRQDAGGAYNHFIFNQGGIGTYGRRVDTAPKSEEQDKASPGQGVAKPD